MIRASIRLVVGLTAALICLGFSGASALASDFHSARTAALGGAGRAGPLLNDGIYLNPSFLAFLQSYTFAGQYEWNKGDAHGRILQASIQDGSSQLLPRVSAIRCARTENS